jgi:hypothetical protein
MRTKKSSSLKRPQLRRCGTCEKVGHNTSTCPVKISSRKRSTTKKPTLNKTVQKNTTSPIKTPGGSPLKFFIHHVNSTPSPSPHLTDLKQKQQDLWNKIETLAPEKDASPLYHTYHKLPSSPPELNTPLLPSTIQKQSFKQSRLHKLSIFDSLKKVTTFVFKSSKKPSLSLEKNIVKNLKPVALKKSVRSFDPHLSFANISSTLKNWTENFSSSLYAIATFPKRLATQKVGIVLALCLVVALILPSTARSYYSNLQATKNTVAENSTAGFMALQESTAALLSAHLPEAQASTLQALERFNTAVTTMEQNHQLLQKIVSVIPVVKNEVQSRQKLILAGQEITLGNTYLIKGISELATTPSTTLTEQLNHIITHLKAAIPNYNQALENLSAVDPAQLPLEYQTTFKDFKLLFEASVHDFKNLADLGDSLQEIFGGKGLRRYLLVFQNSDELRPTGGFMGSFAELDVKDGKIIKFTIPPGGTYDIQGQLNEFVEPPTPLLIANKRWEFQDANWFPDFPASAEKINWFYRHAGRGSTDGVIAINSSVLLRLLSIMGPVTDEKRGVTLTAENAIPLIQTIVEEGPEKKEHRPKQILSDLAPQFLTYLKNLKPNDLMPILVNLKEALDQKEIQAYFADQTTEEQIKSFGWAGQILSSKPYQDYLMVVNTNLQGQKTDAKIKQTIHHQAVVQPDGSIIDNVYLTREHTGNANEKLYGKPNISYLRIYVPQGSELLEARGFSWPDERTFKVPDQWSKKDADLVKNIQELSVEQNSGTQITNEFAKTSFGNWVITEPGETSQVQFSYRLPFKITDVPSSASEKTDKWISLFSNPTQVATYQLITQHQSGTNSALESQIIFPTGWSPIWNDGTDMELAKNGASITKSSLVNDSMWSLAMKKE